jgi:RNA 3'-terminal phosphate cyclase (ATP)
LNGYGARNFLKRLSAVNPGMLEIDGSLGEGGGQVLRTSLSLSAISGRSFVIKNIRMNRSRPGLLSQHLTCVEAVARICNAEVRGAVKRSKELRFQPGLIRSGSYTFDVRTAGSALLVFQTVFPILSCAEEESRIELTGGTHNPKAPPFEFVSRVFLPNLEDLGFKAELILERHGFFPQGGGILKGRIYPQRTGASLNLLDRGTLREMRPCVLIADLDREIANREARVLGRELKRSSLPAEISRTPPGQGPGNAVLLEAGYGEARALFTTFGRKGKRAEAVAHEAVEAWRRFHRLDVPVQPELADQLLLPMALSRGGCFMTGTLTDHTSTNMQIIEMFMDVRFDVEEERSGRIRVEAKTST